MPISTETAPCWRIALPDGTNYEAGYGVRHFRTEQDAKDLITDNDYGELAGATAKAFKLPCVLAICDECDDVLTDADEYVYLHFSTADEVRAEARDYDWTVTPDGRTYHDDCAPSQDA